MTQNPFPDRGASAADAASDEGVVIVDATTVDDVTGRPAPDYAPDLGTPSYDDGPSSTKDVATDQASAVKDTAVDAGKDVAATAKNEAQNVVGEVKSQASGLLDQAKGEANSQAGTQQQRIAGLLGGYSSELQAMTSGQESSGPLTDLARQGADKAGEFSSWLENHEPAELLDEVRSFARRRPVAFLVGAAVAGLVVGRATRNFAANAKDEKLRAEGSTPALPTSTDRGLDQGFDQGSDYARSASLVEEVPTQADAYGTGDLGADTLGADPVRGDGAPVYGSVTTFGTDTATPGYDDPRDVSR